MDFEEKMQAYADAQKDTLVRNDAIDDALFREKHVYRGLRDLNGKGVVTGLTNISKIVAVKEVNRRAVVPRL